MKPSGCSKEACRVAEAMVRLGWTLLRQKKHYVLGMEDAQGRRLRFVLPKSPSDWRSLRNSLAFLRRTTGLAARGRLGRAAALPGLLPRPGEQLFPAGAGLSELFSKGLAHLAG